MQRDIEDVPALPLEPRGQPAQLAMMFQKQHRMSASGKHIGATQACQAAADHDGVVLRFQVLE
jgi:hypothetical protein